jgi:predicted porin
MNMLEGAENTFSTRLGYIGLGHEQYGRVALGTQWSPYYMAAGVVDTPIAWSNGFLYDNHGFFGTARAEKMAAYSNTFDFEGAGALTIGAGWQGYNTATIGGTKFESESRGQAAIGYSISGFNFNYAYNGGDIKDTAANGQTKRAESHLVSGKYGNFGAGLYLAATYGENKNMNARSINSKELMAESEVLDSIAAYGFDNGLNLILKHEEVKDKELNQRADSKSSVQAEYTISPRLRAYTGYQYDHKGTGAYKDGAKDHKWIIGTRFYL